MEPNQQTPTTPNDAEQRAQRFDEEANAVFRAACNTAFLKVPELRSVVVTFDYYGPLNDTPDISKGIWLHAEGKEKPLDSIAGSLGASLQNAAHIFDEMFSHYELLQSQLTELSKAVLDKQNELENLNRK